MNRERWSFLSWKRLLLVLGVGLLTLGTGSWYLLAQSTQPQSLWHSRPADRPAPKVQAIDYSELVTQMEPAVFNISTIGTLRQQQRPTPPRRPRSPQTPRWPWPWPDQQYRDYKEQNRYDYTFPNNPFDHFQRYMRNVPVRSLGTGFLINDQGYALTNYHVIRHATKIRAELRDKRVFEVKVVGKAPFLDLALIKLEAKQATKFPFVYLGDSEKLRVGEPVIAIGNAKGLGLTVTAGILSARGRVLGSSSYDNYLQTDAAINQGNSGGPLFNRNGEVVGINTAILRGGRGIGFAIPINIARHVLPQLIKKGKVERAQLGVFVQAVTPELAQAFGLDSPKGALVSSVMTGSPAAKAGIAAGDIILKVNDKDVRDHNHLPVMIAFRTVGEKLNLTILRKRKQQQVEVTLQPWSDSNQKLPHSESDNGDELDTYNMGTARLGLSVTPISPEIRKQLNLPANTGVLVASVNADGLARQYGIQRGDIILEVNQNTVRSVKQLHSMLSRIPKGGHILLRLQRRNSSLFIAFPLP